MTMINAKNTAKGKNTAKYRIKYEVVQRIFIVNYLYSFARIARLVI